MTHAARPSGARRVDMEMNEERRGSSGSSDLVARVLYHKP